MKGAYALGQQLHRASMRPGRKGPRYEAAERAARIDGEASMRPGRKGPRYPQPTAHCAGEQIPRVRERAVRRRRHRSGSLRSCDSRCKTVQRHQRVNRNRAPPGRRAPPNRSKRPGGPRRPRRAFGRRGAVDGRCYTTVACRSIAENVLPMLETARSVLSAGPTSMSST